MITVTWVGANFRKSNDVTEVGVGEVKAQSLEINLGF
jgi:hypothetical protein